MRSRHHPTPEELIEQRAKLYNPKSRGVYRGAMAGRRRRDAIRAHCIMCMGYRPGEVARCASPHCPLYPYRQGGLQGKAGSDTAKDEIGDLAHADAPGEQ